MSPSGRHRTAATLAWAAVAGILTSMGMSHAGRSDSRTATSAESSTSLTAARPACTGRQSCPAGRRRNPASLLCHSGCDTSAVSATALFRWESILNTPLFVGFPGFVSKLWLAHDGSGLYRGLYEWDGAAAAENYARSLWRVLELVSEPGSIDYRVLPGLRRDAAVDHPDAWGACMVASEPEWWPGDRLAGSVHRDGRSIGPAPSGPRPLRTRSRSAEAGGMTPQRTGSTAPPAVARRGDQLTSAPWPQARDTPARSTAPATRR